MTNYSYLDQMQNLCLRLSNAFKVTRPDDKPLIDLYDAAEEGFFRKKQNMNCQDAGLPITEKQLERVKGFEKFVFDTEQDAAYKLRESEYEGGNSDSNRAM